MRAFVALELSEGFALDVEQLSHRLRGVCSGRFLSRDTYHLTLAFLGDIGQAQVDDAVRAIDAACCGAEPVELIAEGLGTFGKSGSAVLWLGLRRTEQLENLAERVREELRERDVPFDRKAFLPHITLARKTKTPEGKLPDLAFPLPDQAPRVTLFRSVLKPEGASYKPLYSVEMGRGEPSE